MQTLHDSESLLRFARDLQGAHSLREVFAVTHAEIRRVSPYNTIWFAVRDSETSQFVRIVDIVGAERESILDSVTTVPVADDLMLAECFSARHCVVVDDARTDPRTNKQIVQQLQNRTIVNVPIVFIDKPLASLGMGTFGDEGVKVPAPALLDYLLGLSSFLSGALWRLRLVDQERRSQRERAELDRRLAGLQRLDSLGLLAGGVAHDFNNLLTVLHAATSLARMAHTPADVERELTVISEVAARGQALTQQLLAMSRSQPLALTGHDPRVVLGQMVDLMRRVIPHAVRIDLIAPDHGVRIRADRMALDQLFMNLCLNARDAMPDGGLLTIETEVVLVNGAFRETHPWARPGRYLLVSVTDTGHGIPKDHLDRIFEPFFTTKGEKAGTGLGLSVAHGIVQQHEGMLHCYSEVGIGTTFKVYLPLLEREASAVGDKLGTPVVGGPERILVGEDDPSLRGVVRRILERAGYEVAVVPDGAQVVQTLSSEPFDVLLLDVVMPGPTCEETIRRARALQPALRILLASGYTADTNVGALLVEQGIPTISKPYDPDQLLRMLRQQLAGR
ncbi:MAG: hypothetical protein RL385_6060 [Pseudomonadota bacterium]